MHFDNGRLMVRSTNEEFWGGLRSGIYTSCVPAWWFPLNWITHPIYLYRTKLSEMQAKHFDE